MAKKHSSIKWEITFFIVALLVAVIGSLSYFVLDSQKKSLTEEVKLRGLSVAKNLSNNIADAMLTEDELTSMRLLTDAAANKGVKYAEVVDEAGKIKACDDMEKMGSKYLEPQNASEIEAGENRIIIYTDEKLGRMLDFSSPVVAKGKLKLGTAHVGISYSVVEDVLNRAFINVLVISIIAIALGIIGAFAMGIGIASPINVLAKGAKTIGAGNLDFKIKVKSNNELGALAGVFNMMTHDLKKAQEVMVKQQRLERELEVAKEIQLSLIPKDIAAIEGYDVSAYYSPAKEVSGDYYDVMPLDNGKFGFVVGDVSGKGVPAALIMTMARSILHAEADSFYESHVTLQRLNQKLFPDMREGMFITVFYAVLDPESGRIDMASAGHNDTYVEGNGEIVSHNPKGFPIGTDPGPRFDKVIKNDKFTIEKGQVLVAFTDGITEAMNREKQEYGDDRFVAIIKASSGKSAAELVDAVVKDVSAFAGGADQSDDISILVIKRK